MHFHGLTGGLKDENKETAGFGYEPHFLEDFNVRYKLKIARNSKQAPSTNSITPLLSALKKV